MKDYCLELAASKTGLNEKMNCMREYLQAYILRVCHDHGMLRQTAFVGGTALRFLHQLPRFSEDLDFSVVYPQGHSFVQTIQKIKQELILAGYQISISYNDAKTVQYAMVKFEGLMHEAGLSPHASQKLSIKIEVDTKPPEGAHLKTEIVNKFFPLAFFSYDISSLFSGKLHALLNRKYTKGRDFFDVGWYLSRWKDLSPNIELLQNALRQTGWKKELPSEQNWQEFLCKIIEKAEWGKVVEDVKNFLDHPSDMNIFTKENVLKLVRG